jgi:hypothetical protein
MYMWVQIYVHNKQKCLFYLYFRKRTRILKLLPVVSPHHQTHTHTRARTHARTHARTSGTAWSIKAVLLVSISFQQENFHIGCLKILVVLACKPIWQTCGPTKWSPTIPAQILTLNCCWCAQTGAHHEDCPPLTGGALENLWCPLYRNLPRLKKARIEEREAQHTVEQTTDIVSQAGQSAGFRHCTQCKWYGCSNFSLDSHVQNI